MNKITRLACLLLALAILLPTAGCAFSGSARVGGSIRKAEPSPSPNKHVD